MDTEEKYSSIIDSLIIKSFTEDLSSFEKDQLAEWLNSNKDNKSEYQDYLEIWKRSNKMKLSKKTDIEADLEEIHRIAGINKGSGRLLFSLSQIAAVLIISVLLSVFYNFFISKNKTAGQDEIVYQHVRAVFGTQTRIVLPDSTVVYLNSGSTLSFPANFKSKDTRSVDLVGEAYFNVTKDKKHPFIVNVNKFSIRVLGTIFSINAYPKNTRITVALEEGSIKLEPKQKDSNTKNIILHKNQLCIYNQTLNQYQVKEGTDISRYTQWIQGKIILNNEDIHDFVEKLENWYNLEIEIADKQLERYRFTGTFVDEPIEQVLDIIGMTSRMKYISYPAKKLTDNTYSKRKIVLKLKN